jgi:hypothetical protein
VTVANPLDVAARLALGRPVIDDVEEYVGACRRLGYEHPDLTMHSRQVHDWYVGGEGLDLRALDSDHGALSAAASAAEDAARMQTDLVAELDAAWSGRGAVAAHEFIWRSCQSATTVSTALRAAADAVATLRDALWQAVDATVRATEAIDGKQQPQRAEWLAAAKAVTTGAGDVAAASELIDLQVKPFVDRDVGSDWLAAMRDASSSIDAAYDTAIAGATAPVAVFGVPGVLGPRAEPSRHGGGADDGGARSVPLDTPIHTVPAAAVGSAPASVAPSPAPAPAASWASPEPAALPPSAAPMAPPPTAPSMPPMPSMPSSGDLGAGTSSIGSGLSGFGQQLAELIGGLVGSADGLPEPADLDEPTDLDEQDDPEAEPEEPVVEEGEAEAVDEPEEPAPEPPPIAEATPTPAPLPPEPAPAPQGVGEAVPEVVGEAVAQTLPEEAEPTPCEIAADELPQVGE